MLVDFIEKSRARYSVNNYRFVLRTRATHIRILNLNRPQPFKNSSPQKSYRGVRVCDNQDVTDLDSGVQLHETPTELSLIMIAYVMWSTPCMHTIPSSLLYTQLIFGNYTFDVHSLTLVRVRTFLCKSMLPWSYPLIEAYTQLNGFASVLMQFVFR